jgi:hypothetical protein
MVSCSKGDTDVKLRVLENEYPRAWFFRVTESTYEPYEEWERNFERLMGIQGKALDEEIIGRMERNPEFFTRFKQNHPEQLVLLHFNGNARDPRFRRENFFAGHWVYYPGASILSGVPAGEDISEIRVSDATLFRMNSGRYNDRNDDIGLCELDENGKPDWHASEQVQLLSIDTLNHIIRVKRGCYGTEARAFPAGSYAAAHANEGPWGEKNHLMWFYNYSTLCPVDKEGMNCKDRLVEDVLGYFLPGGELEAFDGLQFDVLWAEPWIPADDRIPDMDADGSPDMGIFDGLNTWALGQWQMLNELRRGLDPGRIIMADAFWCRHQRGFGILNGMESEGWPTHGDSEFIGWSGGINRHLFWIENSLDPGLTYMKQVQRGAGQRLVLAGACLTGSAIALASQPYNKDGERNMKLWDELVMGQENRPGWMGEPVAPSVCLAKLEEDLMVNQHPGELLERLNAPEGSLSFAVDGEWVRIESTAPLTDSIVFTISDITAPTEDLTVFLSMKGEPLGDYPESWGRIVTVNPAGYEHPGKKDFMKTDRSPVYKSSSIVSWYMTYMNQESFESSFYYPGLEQERVDLEVRVEGDETIWISNVRAYAAPDARARAFENAVVLANPAPHPHTFDLSELFPGKQFMRLKGSPDQDTVANDGSAAGSEVELPGKDALFLVTLE